MAERLRLAQIEPQPLFRYRLLQGQFLKISGEIFAENFKIVDRQVYRTICRRNLEKIGPHKSLMNLPLRACWNWGRKIHLCEFCKLKSH